MDAVSSARVAQDDLVQVNVRLRRPLVEISRRIAAAKGESLTGYIDRLLREDMERERAALLERFEEEERAVRTARQAALNELDALTTPAPTAGKHSR